MYIVATACHLMVSAPVHNKLQVTELAVNALSLLLLYRLLLFHLCLGVSGLFPSSFVLCVCVYVFFFNTEREFAQVCSRVLYVINMLNVNFELFLALCPTFVLEDHPFSAL
jgi:hypothetical protein